MGGGCDHRRGVSRERLPPRRSECFARKDGVYAEWCVNEKVAVEVGLGASAAGARARHHEARRSQRRGGSCCSPPPTPRRRRHGRAGGGRSGDVLLAKRAGFPLLRAGGPHSHARSCRFRRGAFVHRARPSISPSDSTFRSSFDQRFVSRIPKRSSRRASALRTSLRPTSRTPRSGS